MKIKKVLNISEKELCEMIYNKFNIKSLSPNTFNIKKQIDECGFNEYCLEVEFEYED